MQEAHRNGTLHELFDKRRRARLAAAPPLDLKLEPAQLDVAGMEHNYAILKQLLTAEYGAPNMDDGPLQEDPEWAEMVAAQSGTEVSEVMLHCRTSQWETPRTFASLRISPAPFGRRIVVGVLQSMAHSHLLNAAPSQ